MQVIFFEPSADKELVTCSVVILSQRSSVIGAGLLAASSLQTGAVAQVSAAKNTFKLN